MIEIPVVIVEVMRREACAAYPGECCGLLIGKREGERVFVKEAAASANLETGRRDRYVVDPRVIMAADRRALEAGMEIVGVYHSHPDHEAAPSRTDRELAWEGLVYVIVQVNQGAAGEMRAWRADGGAEFVEMPVE